jgi:VIT1/CCC1 family predicted Fe2+/Mn2+ transporter
VDLTEPQAAFKHKKALETEVEVLRHRTTSIALRTVVYALEERIQELDDFLAAKGFTEDQAMAQKKLQENSSFSELDLDGDGIVSDTELAAVEALSKHEKADAQRRMAWVAMGSMIGFTIAVFLPIFPDARIKALSDLFGLFYIGQAGVVGAYMGMTAYMSKGK